MSPSHHRPACDYRAGDTSPHCRCKPARESASWPRSCVSEADQPDQRKANLARPRQLPDLPRQTPGPDAGAPPRRPSAFDRHAGDIWYSRGQNAPPSRPAPPKHPAATAHGDTGVASRDHQQTGMLLSAQRRPVRWAPAAAHFRRAGRPPSVPYAGTATRRHPRAHSPADRKVATANAVRRVVAHCATIRAVLLMLNLRPTPTR